MQYNKEEINIILRDDNIKIIEQKINDYSPKSKTVGYKLKNKYGTIWLSSDQFGILFIKKQNLF